MSGDEVNAVSESSTSNYTGKRSRTDNNNDNSDSESENKRVPLDQEDNAPGHEKTETEKRRTELSALTEQTAPHEESETDQIAKDFVVVDEIPLGAPGSSTENPCSPTVKDTDTGKGSKTEHAAKAKAVRTQKKGTKEPTAKEVIAEATRLRKAQADANKEAIRQKKSGTRQSCR